MFLKVVVFFFKVLYFCRSFVVLEIFVFGFFIWFWLRKLLLFFKRCFVFRRIFSSMVRCFWSYFVSCFCCFSFFICVDKIRRFVSSYLYLDLIGIRGCIGFSRVRKCLESEVKIKLAKIDFFILFFC